MKRGEQGYVLVATLALLTILAAIVALRFLRQPTNDFEQQSISEARSRNLDLLEDARLRLITGAIQNEKSPGTLPCPDRDNQGLETSCSALQAKTPGRFPYKDDGTPMIPMPNTGNKDAITDRTGECVWYALSPSLRKSNIQLGSRSTSAPDMLPINPDNYGSLSLNNQAVIAVLIAPEKPILNQRYVQELGAQSERGIKSPCNTGVGAAFMEMLDSSNNAGSTGAFADSGAPTALDKATGLCMRKSSITKPENIGDLCNNDVIVALRRDDLMKPLIREVLTRLVAQEIPNPKVVDDILIQSAVPGLLAVLAGQKPPFTLQKRRDALGAYEFDKIVFGEDINGQDESNGCFKSKGSGVKYDPRPLWLCSNQWYKFIDYDGDNTLTIRLDRSRNSSFKCSVDLADPARIVTCL